MTRHDGRVRNSKRFSMDGVEDEEEHLIQSVQVMEKMLFNTYLDMSLCIYIYIFLFEYSTYIRRLEVQSSRQHSSFIIDS